MKKWIGTTVILLFAMVSRAVIIHIPADFATIAGAVESASEGDTVLVARGTYTQPGPFTLDKAVTLASPFLFSRGEADKTGTIIAAARPDMKEWFELSAVNSQVIGFTFMGNEEHTVNITSEYASVLHCRFIDGKDQLSLTGGGGRVAYCYFENAGDDGIDCDNTISWIIEHNTIVNAHQDGIEVRLQDKGAPLTTHIFRYNTVIGSGESGIQLIDYQDDSFREFYIHNNVFLHCRGAGVSCMYQEKDNTKEVYKGSLMQEKAFVYNNTFNACNYGLTISPHLVILNNIFVDLKTIGIERGVYVDDNNDYSIVDYCLFYNNPQHYDADVRIGTEIMLDKDPLLNLRQEPQTDSPCIDAGTAFYSWKGDVLDIATANFTGKAPDLGAREYGEITADVNQPPLVDAGSDGVLIFPHNRFTLNGSVLDDGLPEGGGLTIRWNTLSGPGAVAFSDPEEPVTEAAFSDQGSYELMLTGDDSEYRVRDRVRIDFVSDHSERTVSAGDGLDVFVEAEDYLFLAGAAEVATHDGASGKVIRSTGGDDTRAYSEYRISTLSPGNYHIWISVSGTGEGQNDVYASFENLTEEQKLRGTSDGDFGYESWQKAVFADIPEGLYPLRIRAASGGVMWDRLFITTDADRHPLD